MSLKKRSTTGSDNSSLEDCEETPGFDADPWSSPYHSDEPSVREWFTTLAPTRKGALQYGRGLLVFLQWLPHYDPSWVVGDAIAGITVGFVVIPQAMAYALLASLPPQYGLYTSFAGAVLYWIFGTSKDVIIGVCLTVQSEMS
jgi:solute carrier family 26 (sodium-independent sulfate anion transporter), member 11